MIKKLLLIGSNSVHTYNFYALVKPFFEEIVLITTSDSDFADEKMTHHYTLDASLHHPLNYFTAVRKLRAIIQNENPDIIHIQQIVTYHFLTLRAIRKINIPTVATAWGSDILLNPQKGFFYKKMVQYCLNHTDYLTADAQFIAEKMQQLSKKKLSVTIANFGIDDVNDTLIHKENLIYSNRLLNKLYRTDSIIDAFHRFHEKEAYRDWKLVIAGTGTEDENLKKLVSDLELTEVVQFVGWQTREDNLQWYAKSKIWIAYPESDATSISLLEAMSLRCIPMITDLPATREWISNGENGCLIKDMSSFQIEKALEIPYDDLVMKNREIIENMATKSANQKKFVAIYQSIMNHQNEK